MENSPGSAFGPIIVMIDASRLSHSLATALKDRPHGIPTQPNPTLPLRPPPPPPIRTSLAQSPKNSPSGQATVTRQATRKGAAPKDAIKKDGVRTDTVPSLRVVGMNFYDSRDEEDSQNDKQMDDHSPTVSKGIGKSRHTKSLDNYCSDESNCEDIRRKSSDYEEILRDFDTKGRNVSSFEWASDKSNGKIAKRDKERRGRKRKSSSAVEEDSDLSRKAKYPRVKNSDLIGPAGKLTPPASQTAETRNSVSKSRNSTDRIESSGMELPTIYKYRNSGSTSPQRVDKNTHSKAPDCAEEASSWKQTSSNTYKRILPKPAANIPKCPMAIPIEVAHAMKQGDLRNSNSNTGTNGTHITTSQNGNVAATNQSSNSIKPKTNIETSTTHVPETIEDIENSFLPSMPSLEDMMQNEGLQEKLITLHANWTDIQSTDSNSGKELIPMVEARVLQLPGDFLSETNSLNANELVQEDMNVVDDHKFNKPHESIVNLTTVLEIQIPGRSPELIILKAPQIMASGKADGMANNSPVEAITPVSLSSAIKPAMEEPKTIEEATKIDTISGLRGYRKENPRNNRKSEDKMSEDNKSVENDLSGESSPSNDHQLQGDDLSGENQTPYILHHKSPVEFEIRIKDTSSLSETQETVQKHGENGLIDETEQEISKDSQARPNVEDIVRSRKNRYNLKLRKLYQEEAHLKCKMSQTSDPSRLTRLQQKINCAEKKIENTQKYLSKLVSIENPGLYANRRPLRIQVRRDLVQKIPSPEALEPASQSPLRPTSETDKASTGRSPPILSPVVITISETDSASSGNETDASDEKSPDNVKPHLKSDLEMKFNFENTTGNDTKVSSPPPGDPSLDYKADNILLNMDPEKTNNNSEYLDKNSTAVPETVNTAVIGSPQIPESPNTASISIPQIPTSPNTASISIPKVPVGVNTASMSIPPLIPDPIDFSMSNPNSVAHQKSPSAQYSVPSLNFPPDKVDSTEQGNSNCKCLHCLRVTGVPASNNTAKFKPNNYIPNAANDLRTPSTIRRTAIQENTNVNPVPNYPVQHADHKTTENVPGMFSRDNGGANINLSSPLQGHSALPVPSSYYRNLTAQGYPIPAEPSPNQQTSQWYNQHPPGKPSMEFTPDQDVPLYSSILASHLLNSNPQDSANYPSSIKLSSLAQGKDVTRTNPAKHVSERIMTAQFPTLGNYAAQMTRESSPTGKPANNLTADRTGYKTTGSDMYKMAATAIDPTHVSPRSVNNTIHWAPGRPGPAEQPRPTQGYPSQRIIPPQHYRRDYPPNPQIPQNLPNAQAGYPGAEVFYPGCPTNPYNQMPSGPQSTRSNDRSNSQPFHAQQNARQYQLQSSSTRPLAPATNYQGQKNSPQMVNPMGYMPQQYIQQPPSYLQSMLLHWQSANNYHNNYIASQYNGYNVQSNKPMEQNQTVYRPTSKNHSPLQPQPQHISAASQLAQNLPNAKLPSPMYSMPGNLNPVVQDVRNADMLDIRRSYRLAPQLSKIQKSVDRLSSGLKCSLCGTPGPKFNCFGCEAAFYCNRNCQTQHWNTHFIECSKKMPKLKKVS